MGKAELTFTEEELFQLMDSLSFKRERVVEGLEGLSAFTPEMRAVARERLDRLDALYDKLYAPWVRMLSEEESDD